MSRNWCEWGHVTENPTFFWGGGGILESERIRLRGPVLHQSDGSDVTMVTADCWMGQFVCPKTESNVLKQGGTDTWVGGVGGSSD